MSYKLFLETLNRRDELDRKNRETPVEKLPQFWDTREALAFNLCYSSTIGFHSYLNHPILTLDEEDIAYFKAKACKHLQAEREAELLKLQESYDTLLDK